MFDRTAKILLTVLAALFLLSCVIEEELRIHGDGSGTYRVRIAIPKTLDQGFDEFRKEAEQSGFEIVQEGQTDQERFLIIRKDFTDITALNDSTTHFELTITEAGFLRREYRLRASLKAVGFGSFKRHLTVRMPGKVSSTTNGEITGSGVQWQGSTGGTIEIISAGLYLPLTRSQNIALALIAITGVLFLIVARRRRRQSASSICFSCNTPLRNGARFCGACGATTPIVET
jgi:hypothetical protein